MANEEQQGGGGRQRRGQGDAASPGGDVAERARSAKAEDATDARASAQEDAGAQHPAVASLQDNADLKHSVELDENWTPGDAESGATTTRKMTLDEGAPMVQGHPSEPVGPEDAFGEGPKRGDYTSRLGGVLSQEARPVPGGGEPIYDDAGNIADFTPHTVLVDQNVLAEDVGDAEGVKGGVGTDPRAQEFGVPNVGAHRMQQD